MNYKDKLQAITTVKELFDFREELKALADTKEPCTPERQELLFYIDRVVNQIKHLENKGVFLANIEVPNAISNEKS